MLVVSNSRPLIALAAIQRLDLLSRIFEHVIVPPAVVQEISPSIPVIPTWLSMRALAAPLSPMVVRGSLGDGERQAISLAIEQHADLLVVDDLPARRLAQSIGTSVVGTAGILWPVKRRGLISSVRHERDSLLRNSFYLSPQLYTELLKAAGEAQ